VLCALLLISRGGFDHRFLICWYLFTIFLQLFFCLEYQAIRHIQFIYFFTLGFIGRFIGPCFGFIFSTSSYSNRCRPRYVSFVLYRFLCPLLPHAGYQFASISNVTSICGNPPWCRWNAIEIEYAQALIVLCHTSFTLHHMYLHTRLVIAGG